MRIAQEKVLPDVKFIECKMIQEIGRSHGPHGIHGGNRQETTVIPDRQPTNLIACKYQIANNETM